MPLRKGKRELVEEKPLPDQGIKNFLAKEEMRESGITPATSEEIEARRERHFQAKKARIEQRSADYIAARDQRGKEIDEAWEAEAEAQSREAERLARVEARRLEYERQRQIMFEREGQ